MLEIRDLTKRYRGATVVDGVSFSVRPGEVTGYLGPNGSGKSTTVKMIIGLVAPTAGRVFLDGRDIRKDMLGFRRRLGYVPEEAILYPYLSGLEYLQLTGRLRGLPDPLVDRRANDLLALFSLHPHRHGALSSYSKGMRQRVLISAAMLHNPDLPNSVGHGRHLSPTVQSPAWRTRQPGQNDPLHLTRAGSRRKGLRPRSCAAQRACHGRRFGREAARPNGPALTGGDIL